MASGTPEPVQRDLREGIHAVERDLFAAARVELVEPGQALIEALRTTGRDSPDLIFCHFPGESHVVVEEAPAYRETFFVTIPGRAVGVNVTGVALRVDGAAYVAGATLAAASGDRPVLLVPAEAAQSLPGLVAGFRAGVLSVHGTVLEGADLASAQARVEAGGPGALFYAGFGPPKTLSTVCAAGGIPMVAAGSGLGGDGTGACLGRVVVRMGEAVRRLARERWAGTLEGRMYTYSLGSGVVDFELRPGSSLPDRVRKAMEAARADVLAGIAEIEDLKM